MKEKRLIIPKDYHSDLSIKQTEQAIKALKDFFQVELAKALNLERVSAPLFVRPETGLNDNLNGVERPVAFDVKSIEGNTVEVVHSLAKWKRIALKRYGFEVGEGLYTDMNAIRRDEDTDNLHSIYVDQWDWEKIIDRGQRNQTTLKQAVTKIYQVFLKAQDFVAEQYGLQPMLPEEIHFITTQELEDLYPQATAKQREDKISKKYKAVFIMQIGARLKSGEKHDGRAPDYDDWQLNGDIIFYHPILNRAFEISSMGIRVDEDSLLAQLKIENCMDRANLPFHRALLNQELPYTIGGGIGQSRLCMFFLQKAHIGEVQSSIWSDQMVAECAAHNIELL